MGFFDKMKKRAQEVVSQTSAPPAEAAPAAAPVPAAAAPVPAAAAPPAPAPAPAPAAATAPAPAPAMAAAAAPAPAPAAAMAPPPPSSGSFTYDGDTLPLPGGWDGLSIEDWFYKFESVRDRLMNIDDEQGLPPMADEDGDPLDPEEVLLITAFGFQDGGHWEKFRTWSVAGWAQQTGESPTDCEFRMGGIARERIMAEKAGAMGGPGGALEPVEGVSCEQWAQMQAQIGGGGDVGTLIAAAGIDQAKWDRVSAEWMARMSSDTTMAVMTVYSNAFAAGSGGQFAGAAAHAADVGVGGDLGAEPIPFEKFVEIMEAQSAASQKGEDVNALLGTFDMTAIDWSNVSQYWNKKMQQEADKYYNLFTEYSAKYQGIYGTGDGLTNDEREEMIYAKILEMAGSGQAAQILPYLKDYFPEDADDNDVMDGWLDKACDMCEVSGDRARAEQIMPLRYPLQDDEDDPMAEWVQSQLESLFM